MILYHVCTICHCIPKLLQGSHEPAGVQGNPERILTSSSRACIHSITHMTDLSGVHLTAPLYEQTNRPDRCCQHRR